MGFDAGTFVVIAAAVALVVLAYAPTRLRAAARRGRRPDTSMHRDAGAASLGAGMSATDGGFGGGDSGGGGGD